MLLPCHLTGVYPLEAPILNSESRVEVSTRLGLCFLLKHLSPRRSGNPEDAIRSKKPSPLYRIASTRPKRKTGRPSTRTLLTIHKQTSPQRRKTPRHGFMGRKGKMGGQRKRRVAAQANPNRNHRRSLHGNNTIIIYNVTIEPP